MDSLDKFKLYGGGKDKLTKITNLTITKEILKIINDNNDDYYNTQGSICPRG